MFTLVHFMENTLSDLLPFHRIIFNFESVKTMTLQKLNCISKKVHHFPTGKQICSFILANVCFPGGS